MSAKSELHIDLKDLAQGRNSYDYQLDNSFFEQLPDADIKRGDVKASVSVTAHGDYFTIDYCTDGTVVIPCDRCLDDMEQPVSGQDTIVVRQGNPNDSTDDIVFIGEQETKFDMSWLLYEQIALAVPLQHTHQEGLCNPSVASHIMGASEQLQAENNETDPRWDSLKDILNNNN